MIKTRVTQVANIVETPNFKFLMKPLIVESDSKPIQMFTLTSYINVKHAPRKY